MQRPEQANAQRQKRPGTVGPEETGEGLLMGRKRRGLGSNRLPNTVNALKVTKLYTGKRSKHTFCSVRYLHAEEQTGRPDVLQAMCHRVGYDLATEQ